jgi:assimilatory nitrate reductase catalytic subunit
MGKATTTEQIGDCLKAGTNCGSCLPELKSLVERNKKTEAAF